MDPSTGKNIPMIHSCSWYINIRRTILPNASAIAPLGYDHMQQNCLAKSAAISLFCAGKSATANSQQLYQICLHIFLRRYRAKKEKKHTLYPPSGIPTETHLQFHGLLCTAGLPCDCRCSSRMGCDIITGGRLCREAWGTGHALPWKCQRRGV